MPGHPGQPKASNTAKPQPKSMYWDATHKFAKVGESAFGTETDLSMRRALGDTPGTIFCPVFWSSWLGNRQIKPFKYIFWIHHFSIFLIKILQCGFLCNMNFNSNFFIQILQFFHYFCLKRTFFFDLAKLSTITLIYWIFFICKVVQHTIFLPPAGGFTPLPLSLLSQSIIFCYILLYFSIRCITIFRITCIF